MTAQHPGRRARRGTARRVVLAASLVTVGSLLAASCSGDDTASTSTTTTTAPGPATTRPTLPPAGTGNDQPLPVAWVTQVGGAGADSLAGATGRRDTVVAVGTTTGVTAPARSGTDALVVSVDAGNGTVRTTTQLGADGAVSATSVTSAPTGLTLACGSTSGALAAAPAGGTDAWCGQVTPAGAIEGPVQLGGDSDDSIAAVAVTGDGDHAYAAGRTDSLFPGARDTTGGYVGGGDALLLRLDAGARPQWARQFGSADADEAGAVATSDDGDAIVGGTTAGRTGDSSSGGTDGWLARLDQDGMQRWQTQFGSTADDRIAAVGVGGDATRGTETFVAGGSTRGAVGGATGAAPAGGTDALAVAFDSSGKQVWARQFGSAADDTVTGVVFDGSTVYVAGTAGGPIVGAERVPLVPTPADGASTTTAPPTTAPSGDTGRDGFLAALDAATGQVRWTSTFGSPGNDDVTSLSRTETGLLVVSGTTDGRVGASAPGGRTDGFLIAFRLPQSGGGAASAV
jgi:hypothetical protein